MEQCEFCGAPLAAGASFCGRCGHAPVSTSHHPTQIGVKPEFPADENKLTSISRQSAPQSGEFDATSLLAANAGPDAFSVTFLSEVNAQQLENAPTHLLPSALPLSPDDLAEDDDREEEKRRRAALLGLALPLAGALPNAPAGPAFVLPGTPQLGQMPVLPGVPGAQPPLAAGTAFPGAPSSFGTPGSPLSSPGGLHPGPGSFGDPGPGPSGHPGPGGSGNPGPGSSPTGCLSIGLIISIVLLVILGSTATLGLTVFRPIISLSGNTSVAPGGTLALQGSSFLPNSSVTLTLDNFPTPLYYIQRDTPARLAGLPLQGEMSASQLLRSFSQSKQTVNVQGDGTFSIAIKVDPRWPAGQHTLHASETLTHRGASLNFTITQAGATVTPGVTSTVTSTVTPTVTPTATATATNTSPSLSCATPGSLALGPLSEKSSQLASSTITLCSSGSGQISWQASWNASWLQLSQSQGTIQAPNQLQLTATASAAQLAAGNYQTTITFASPQGSQTVQVSLTVQAGCVNATPARLGFSGVANTSDPASQSVSVTNCGLTSDWSASITAGSGWLSVKPGKGTLNGGASGKITVRASNLNAGLKAGQYSGAIVVTIGSQKSTITVSLLVQDAPQLAANTTSINGYYCATDASGGYDSCWVTLTNTSKTSSLTWSSAASVSGVIIKPNSNTLAPGASERVNILVPKGYEKTKVAITFTGPGNSVVVDWYYQIIIT
ncbi:MAG TPA: hypothetical protein VF458_23875 [Ktedonobacteraceae bacterium]